MVVDSIAGFMVETPMIRVNPFVEFLPGKRFPRLAFFNPTAGELVALAGKLESGRPG